jgi:hypothetical protein
MTNNVKKISARKQISKTVKMINAALEERGNFIVLRGVIDPGSLDHLLLPDYQREVLSRKNTNELAEAIRTSKVPDIELAVRGGDFAERGDSFYIHSPTYILDGLQRVSGARKLLQEGEKPFLGAIAYFNTKQTWEQDRFRILNAERVRVSPNILLRNMRLGNQALKLVYELTKRDQNFVLHDRVCWNQRQARTEVITVLNMLKTVRALHAHESGLVGTRFDEVAAGMERLMNKIGRQLLRDNIVTFFHILDNCWSIRNVVFAERQTHLKGTFLFALADVMSRYLDFWVGSRLVCERSLVRKLAQFPLHDPEVKSLAGAGGQSRKYLSLMIADHINSGKRTKRLRPRVLKEIEICLDDQIENAA